jgi:hypothetical protein
MLQRCEPPFCRCSAELQDSPPTFLLPTYSGHTFIDRQGKFQAWTQGSPKCSQLGEMATCMPQHHGYSLWKVSLFVDVDTTKFIMKPSQWAGMSIDGGLVAAGQTDPTPRAGVMILNGHTEPINSALDVFSHCHAFNSLKPGEGVFMRSYGLYLTLKVRAHSADGRKDYNAVLGNMLNSAAVAALPLVVADILVDGGLMTAAMATSVGATATIGAAGVLRDKQKKGVWQGNCPVFLIKVVDGEFKFTKIAFGNHGEYACPLPCPSSPAVLEGIAGEYRLLLDFALPRL